MTHCPQIARTHVAAALVGAIVASATSAPAQASTRTGAEQLAGQICQTVIRLQPGENHFNGCVSSLADSVESISRSQAVVRARTACFAQHLKPGSADLSLCLLRAADTKPDSDAVDLPTIVSAEKGITDDAQSSGTYFAAQSHPGFRREQQACALVGFDPAFGAFANCVANLQSTLRAGDTPDE
jgi:hypothetical protein